MVTKLLLRDSVTVLLRDFLVNLRLKSFPHAISKRASIGFDVTEENEIDQAPSEIGRQIQRLEPVLWRASSVT